MAYQSIGLDIGSSAVRAVELSIDEGRQPALVNFGQVGLEPGCVVAGEVRDPAKLADALRRLWHEGHFAHRQVRVGVAGLRAIIRELDMPLLPPSELDSAVRFKADDVIPFDMNETVLSSKVIAQVAQPDGPPMLRVLVGAAQADVVESAVSALELAGLEPVSIDLQTAALARAIFDPHFQLPEAIVSIGAELTMIVVHQMGTLQFVRTLDMGGDTITGAISGALDIPHRDAEASKRRLGYPGAHDSLAAGTCERAVRELVNEIQNSIRFFGSLPGRQPVGRIQLTGGATRTAGLLRTMQETAGVPVGIASPLSRIDLAGLPITNEQAAEVDAVVSAPLGLALPDPTGQSFNLLPPSARVRSLERRIHKYLVRTAAAAAVLIVGLTAMRLLQVQSAQDHLSAINAANATIQNVEIPKYDKALELRNTVAEQSSQVLPTLQKEVDWLVVLNQIAQYIPSNATLQNVSLAALYAPGQNGPPSALHNSKAIGTVTALVNTKTLNDVTVWSQAISQSPIFDLPDLNSSVSGASQTSGVSFSTTLDILNGAASQRISEFRVPG
jgi:type IV pilus assembly protein PilM